MRLLPRVIPALLLLAAAPLGAQVPAPAPAGDVPAPPRTGSPFVLSGEASIFGETYGISGRDPRRPGTTGRVVFQPQLQLTRFFKVGLDLQLTTEGSDAGFGGGSSQLNSFRQRLNQLGVTPTWSWGKLSLGDFTEDYTAYTFSGVRVRGAGTVINPGLLRLAAFGGQSQTAVLGVATNTAYERSLTGGRVGIGRGDGSFLDLIMVRARDDAGSLPPPDDTAFIDPRLEDPTVDPDTLPVGTLLNPLSVTPQENVVLATAGRLVLFDGRLRLQGEVSGAAHTRDVRASPLDNEAVENELPGFLRGLFTPRVGSSYGLAYTASADVRRGSFYGNARVRRVEPGYVALGVSSLLNDVSAWELSGTQRLGRSHSLRLDMARQVDNLFGQKSFTTHRKRYGGVLNLRPLPRWTTSTRVQYVGTDNNLAGAPQWIAYDNWMLSNTHNVLLSRERMIRSFGWGYTYRNSGDDNPARAASNLEGHSADVRVVVAPWQSVSLTPSVGLSSTSSAASGYRLRETYGIAAQSRMHGGRWTSSMSLASTEDRGSGAFHTRLSSRYNLTDSDDITFSLRQSRYHNAPNAFGAPGGFHETTASLQLTRRMGGGNGR